jgi:H+-transporting ATPase
MPPTDRSRGLSDAEVARRRGRWGPNAVPERVVPAWRMLVAKLWAPIPWMLEAIILLQVVLRRDLEATLIGALLIFNASLAYVQERRAHDALALLRRRLRVRARVLRDGVWHLVPAEELVPGDIVHLRAGDIVPADVALFDGRLSLDQAALTGESLPVDAGPGQISYSGSIVRQGEASGEVRATGEHSLLGRTAELVRTANAPSHMQQTIFTIVKRLAAVDGVLAAFAVAYALWRHLPVADSLIFGLMLIVASVPVALPATYTLATAIGSLQLAEQGVLVTRLPAVEEAAAMDTLVSDKTGTLTQNRLTVSKVVPVEHGVDEAAVLATAVLASDEATQDPLDVALWDAARQRHVVIPPGKRRDFTPFDPTTRCSVALYETAAGPWQVMKGATEVVAAACGLVAGEQAKLDGLQKALASSGARVLAVAAGTPGSRHLVGLVGLADPVRPDAALVIAGLNELGVRVRMITGDALETARAIGARLGLGTRICPAMPDDLDHIDDYDIFARVLPAGKYAIVRALQNRGHIVGMTGDGVNDAPALRQAELGVAVANATDVAKAAAGIVLTEPGLGGVLTVVRIGREVHRRMLTYTLNKIVRTLVIVFFLTLGLLLTGRFLMSPTLIVLMLFFNDFATMAIAKDNVQPSPRPQRWHVGRLMQAAAVLGGVSLAGMALLWWGAAAWGASPAQLQTVTFLSLVVTNQTGIYVLRSDRAFWQSAPSPWMIAASMADAVLLATLAGLGILMAPLPWALLGGLGAAAVVLALLLDQFKRLVFLRIPVV